MKLKEIHRTATFAWSPSLSIPIIATGTVSGALDESFSNDSLLELWAPDFLDKSEYDIGGETYAGPKASVTTNSRFNRIVWGSSNSSRNLGVIAAGMENGELELWDPEKILATSDVSQSLILRNQTHQGSVRGLDFNPIQTNLLASGATNGEIFIWDLKDPLKPYSPGSRSSKLDEITALSWNRQVQHVLASASSTGYTVVWDLRGKREVVALAYGGGSASFPGQAQNGRALGIGSRRGMSDVAWHPDNATRLVTSSEDDSSPIVMVWDLRNARAPEKILTGHEKGVLSLSWCNQDADLLLSCGKDNRALCWNPQTSEIIGELPSAENWAFQVQWCPRNPDLLAAAYFDGTIAVHSLQNTNEASNAQVPAVTPRADGSDVFDDLAFARTTQATLSLKQPPKWLKRPTSCSFGFGGKLISVSNLPSAQGKNQSSVVHVHKIVTESSIVSRSEKLLAAQDDAALRELAEEKSRDADGDTASWKALLSLFQADSRDELVTLLGFSKAEIAARVVEAVEKLQASASTVSLPDEINAEESRPHGTTVSFAEPEQDTSEFETELDIEQVDGGEPTPSERSTGALSDITDLTRAADVESTATTAPSLFGEEVPMGTPQTDTGADFFSTMGTIGNAIPDRVRIPHTNYAHDSSVAATVGSRPSSAASEAVRNNTFSIYPSDESEIDRLITKALVLGDFESAVSLCLSSERFADAILLAVRGGPELLRRTQQTYFQKRTIAMPYLRLYQSIVTDDLEDIVQNADLQEWQEILVVLCTFAKVDEFARLAEQLGQRLEFQGSLMRPNDTATANECRKNATLTYLAAGRLEKVVNIWIEEMAEEESRSLSEENISTGARYSAHVNALQTLMEKVAVFRAATKYEDSDSDSKNNSIPSEGGVLPAYKLAGLYDRYFEYADLLATQGLVQEAVKYLKLTPSGYSGPRGFSSDYTAARERLFLAASDAIPAAKTAIPQLNIPSSTSTVHTIPQSSSYAYPQYSTPAQSQGPTTLSSASTMPSIYQYNAPTGTTNSPYASANAGQNYQPTAPMQSYSSNGYAQSSTYNPSNSVSIPAPPPPMSSAPAATAPPPPSAPPQAKEANGGWNDAPVVADRRTPAIASSHKPEPIASPFPNSMPSPITGAPMIPGQPPSSLPPPPRPGSVQQRSPQQMMQGPPPGPGQPLRMPSAPPRGPPGGQFPPRSFSPAQGPGQVHPPPPPQSRFAPGQPGQPQLQPNRALSPAQAAMRQMPPHFAGGHQQQQQQRGPGGQMLPPGGASQRPFGGPPGVPYARGTPPLGQAPGSGPPMARATPPPAPTGPYAPPQGVSRPAPPQGPSLGGGAPLPQNPPRGPPPGGVGGQGAQPVSAPPPPQPKGPPPPKYPPGDRSHIPDSVRRSYNILAGELNRLKQTSPPQQKRMVDDTERRLNALFDALNCETLSGGVISQLDELTEAMANRDPQRALAIHVDLLTRGSRTDDIALWMSAIKQLILRL